MRCSPQPAAAAPKSQIHRPSQKRRTVVISHFRPQQNLSSHATGCKRERGRKGSAWGAVAGRTWRGDGRLARGGSGGQGRKRGDDSCNEQHAAGTRFLASMERQRAPARVWPPGAERCARRSSRRSRECRRHAPCEHARRAGRCGRHRGCDWSRARSTASASQAGTRRVGAHGVTAIICIEKGARSEASTGSRSAGPRQHLPPDGAPAAAGGSSKPPVQLAT